MRTAASAVRRPRARLLLALALGGLALLPACRMALPNPGALLHRGEAAAPAEAAPAQAAASNSADSKSAAPGTDTDTGTGTGTAKGAAAATATPAATTAGPAKPADAPPADAKPADAKPAEAAAAQSAAPAADTAAPQQSYPPAMQAAAKACSRKGGRFGPRSPGSRAYACFTTPRDAGKSCTSANDCSSACLARSHTCAPVSPLFGCQDILTEYGMTVTQCVD